MRLCSHIWAAWLVFLVLFNGAATAATVPAYNGKMNAAVGSVISTKVGKWGFAANDPRVNATAAGVGSGLTTLAVGVAGGAVATVGWPALLVGAGISAVVGGVISLATDAVNKWLFNSDGTITSSGADATGPGAGNCYRIGGAGCYGSILDALLNGTPQANYAPFSGSDQYGDWTRTWVYELGAVPGWSTVRLRQCRANGCGDYAVWSGYITVAGGSVVVVNPDPAPATNVTGTPAVVVAALPDTELAKPLSDEYLAAAANAAWKAADTSQGGLPWSASDPVTPADVAAWRAANPSLAPTVGDAIAPVSSGNTVSVASSSSPQTGPVATPGTGQQVDLGLNPNTPVNFRRYGAISFPA